MKTLLNNSKGHTLIELIIALFIIGMTLMTIISAFMSGRSAIVSAWDSTESTSCAVQLMEQLKATPYDDLLYIIETIDFTGLTEHDLAPIVHLQPECTTYEYQVDFQTYYGYPKESLLQVNVQVRENPDDEWMKKTSIVRSGESE